VNESDTAVWMNRLAALSRTEGALPDPALIWWQARLLERQAARARATRPLAIAQWGSAVLAAVTVMVLCALDWPGIRDVLAPFATLAPWVVAGIVIVWTGLALRLALGE